ncbi:SdpI family protein [Streptococcus ovuberis]|uniref:DUF1648 domain-containing protein n=1 Tax=Streptococcus ovuberis TaxID=1936207 RepID=A0A7X6N2C3_9STRE|nr:SdpI family protein [Streptococcus ovuberis]NKZ20844.1 DUF1648 domain-containing protein [Streptococcus ovuberis]
MKLNKRLLVVTSVFVFLPMLLGVVLWERLPEQLPTHFGLDGSADGFSSKAEAVYLHPFIFLGVHLFSLVVTTISPKSQNISPKMMRLLYWFIPVLAGLLQTITYLVALGWIINPTRFISFLLGGFFMLVGNYLPKTKQNYAVGIKLPWTLDDEENWNKTHRLAGRVWMLAGLLICLSVCFPIEPLYVLLPLIAIMILLPAIYSYKLSRQGEKLDL